MASQKRSDAIGLDKHSRKALRNASHRRTGKVPQREIKRKVSKKNEILSHKAPSFINNTQARRTGKAVFGHKVGAVPAHNIEHKNSIF